MTDLEITKLCAEAMGLSHEWDDFCVWLKVDGFELGCEPRFRTKRGQLFDWVKRYDPLSNDAQAVSLMRRFRLGIEPNQSNNDWLAWEEATGPQFMGSGDLNRAICECVAKVQQQRATGSETGLRAGSITERVDKTL